MVAVNSLRIVLVLLDPPLPFGTAIGRWFYVLLKGLVERGHQVSAFSACRTQEEADEAMALFAPPAYNLRCFAYPVRPGLTAKWQTLRRPHSYPFSDELRASLAQELQRDFDVLHLECVASGWLGLPHAPRALLTVPFLFDIDWSKTPPQSLYEWLVRQMTYRMEKRLLRAYPQITTLSSRLTKRVREIAPASDVQTLPIALDFSLYPFESEVPTLSQPTIGLIASFDWLPGILAGRRLLTTLFPEIKRRCPRARLEIAGRNGRTAFREFLDMPDVRIRDRIPDALDFFRRINMLLYAPDCGSGMKLKVMEAFALGVPVVTNSEGAEGLPAVDGVHAGICDNDEGLITRAVELLSDPAQQQRYKRAARAMIETHCHPRIVLDRLESVYEKIVDADQEKKRRSANELIGHFQR
jgi:glycosyltransferase involved in cell wall biosynthesis